MAAATNRLLSTTEVADWWRLTVVAKGPRPGVLKRGPIFATIFIPITFSSGLSAGQTPISPNKKERASALITSASKHEMNEEEHQRMIGLSGADAEIALEGYRAIIDKERAPFPD